MDLGRTKGPGWGKRTISGQALALAAHGADRLWRPDEHLLRAVRPHGTLEGDLAVRLEGAV